MKLRYILYSLILMLFVTSCKTSKTIESVHDTLYINNKTIDYKYLHDSIYIDRWHNVYTKGDTIFMTDSVVKYKYVINNDTFICTDTIYKVRDNFNTEYITVNKYPIWPYILFIVILATVYIYFKYIRKHIKK